MILQDSVESLLGVVPTIQAGVNLCLPNQCFLVRRIERKGLGKLSQFSLLIPCLIEDGRLGKMRVDQARIERQGNLAISLCKLESAGGSPSGIQVAVGVCQHRMSNGIVRVQLRCLLVLVYGRVEPAVVWLLHEASRPTGRR